MLWKWIRRIAIALLAATLLAVFSVAGAAWWYWSRTNAELRRVKAVAAENSLLARRGATAPSAPGSRSPRAAPPAAFDTAAFQEPPASAAPWIRWWWPGNQVQPAELTRELEELAARGFAGVEIHSLGMRVRPDVRQSDEWREDGYGSARHRENLQSVVEAATRVGLEIDLSAGSGWPSGGPEVAAADGMRTLTFGELEVSGPTRVEEPIPAPRVPPTTLFAALASPLSKGRGVDFRADLAEPMAVLAARRTGAGDRGWNPTDPAWVVDLDTTSVLSLDDRVTDGVLRWDAPAGTWRIIAIYQLPSGEMVHADAHADPAYVLDHFDRDRLAAYYDHHTTETLGLSPTALGSPIRALFHDGFEFEADRLTARGILEEFEARRGYDLAPLLPAVLVPGADHWLTEVLQLDTSPSFQLDRADDRVRFDYARTLSDLFIDRFLGTASAWTREHGLRSRIQPYGFRVDVIRAAGAVDIPETEQLYAGGTNMALKMVTSGAMLYDRPLVSGEAFVWSGLDYAVTPQRMKMAVDKLFAAGVNHTVYHGHPYRTGASGENAAYGDEGWFPWSAATGGGATFSTNLSEVSPFWDDLTELNRYVARSQYLLRTGSPTAEVLVYYPFIGFPQNRARVLENLVGGRIPGLDPIERPSELPWIPTREDPRRIWAESVHALLLQLDRQGVTWAWVDDASLDAAQPDGDGSITIRGQAFGTILVPEVTSITRDAIGALHRLAGGGARVWFVGRAPDRQAGFRDHLHGDAVVHRQVSETIGAENGAQLDTDEATSRLSARAAISFAESTDDLRLAVRRSADDGRLVFVHSIAPDERPLALRIAELPQETRVGQWLDATTGASAPAVTDAAGLLRRRLPGWGSTFLRIDPPAAWAPGEPIPAPDTAERIGIPAWDLVVEGRSVKYERFEEKAVAPFDWREREVLAHAVSPGHYSARVELPPVGADQRIVLDLGVVHGSATVRWNGAAVGRRIFAPYRLDVTAVATDGANTVEIIVQGPLRNHLRKRANSDNRYLRFKRAFPVPMGILGPTTIEVQNHRLPAAAPPPEAP